jgi:DeoR family transcriptional regulator of aga operon
LATKVALLTEQAKYTITLESPYVNDRSVSEKEFINATEKAAIGQQAAKMIEEDQYIILASGTTVLAMAEYINPLQKLTVVTSALNVGLKLSQRKNVEVLQLGGYIRSNSYSVIGHYSEMILKETVCSKLFLGVDGLDLKYGLNTTNYIYTGDSDKFFACIWPIWAKQPKHPVRIRHI